MKVSWQELVQFSVNPTTVKLSTVQKSISDLKKAFTDLKIEVPFDVKFENMIVENEQKIVQVKRTPAGKVVSADDTRHVAQIDFQLDTGYQRIVCSTGKYQVNDNEWLMFKYFHSNPGKVISISELRDKVAYPLYGSKLPARWFDSIGRTINNLRRQVFGLEKRLLTVKGAETSYLFQ